MLACEPCFCIIDAHIETQFFYSVRLLSLSPAISLFLALSSVIEWGCKRFPLRYAGRGLWREVYPTSRSRCSLDFCVVRLRHRWVHYRGQLRTWQLLKRLKMLSLADFFEGYGLPAHVLWY